MDPLKPITAPPRSVEEAAERIAWWWMHFGARRGDVALSDEDTHR